MTCLYIFKNKRFSSEIELNDYLLSTESLKSKLGDLVYQLRGPQRRYASKLKHAEETYKRLKDNGILIDTVKKEDLEPEDLDDIGTLKYPYISVSDLIHTMPGRYKDLVFPIFNSDNYWEHKFEEYKNGIFNAYEVQFLTGLIETDSGGNIKKVTDPETLNKIRERMEGVINNGKREGGLWLQQAICGNMIHTMASLFYRQRIKEGGKFLYLCSQSEVIDWFEKNISKEYPLYEPYISKKIIKSSVERFFLLDAEIRLKWGKDAYIRTEQAIVGDIDMKLEGNQLTKVIGRIDLLVIGKDGSIGIIDYKCSPKDYTTLNVDKNPFEYNSAKILTFKYLLATYRKILSSMQINPSKVELFIAPLKFEGFKMEDGKVSFDSISSLGDSARDTILQKLSNSDLGDEKTKIESNLDLLFPPSNYSVNVEDIDNILTDVQETMKRLLPVSEKDTSEEGILELIKNNGGIRKNSSTGEWEYRPRKTSDLGYRHFDGNLSEQEALTKLKEALTENAEYNEHYSVETASSLRKSYVNYYHDNGDNPLDKIQTLASKKSTNKKKAEYLKYRFKKYSDTTIWQPISDETLDPILDLYGILLFRNKHSNLIDVVKISNLYDPTLPVKLRKGKYLLGNFLKDDIAHGSADSLTMTSTAGNIELMETMHVLNRLHASIFKYDNVGIGNIDLICPRMQTGLKVSNEQLLYNYDRLCKLDKNFKNNNYLTAGNPSGTIKMATYVDLVNQDFAEIIKGEGSEEGFDILYKDVKTSVSKLDFEGKSKEEIKLQLLALDKKLVEHYGHITKNVREGNFDTPETILHRDILYAIAELSGIKMIQQLEHSSTFSFKGGISGTIIDNPGTLLSQILNQATNLVTIAYQNVRDSVLRFDVELRKKLKALKDSKNFGWIQLNLTGNQVKDLYLNMYDKNSKDFRFVNPWSPTSELTTEESDFLKYALIKINSTRRNLDLEELLKNPDKMANLIKQDEDMLLVPLTKGSFASEVTTRGGIVEFIEDRFKYIEAIWNKEVRQQLFDRVNEKVTNFMGDKNNPTRNSINRGDQWETVNSMHRLDLPENIEDRRTKILLVGGIDYYEHNLETILLKQHSAYTMAEELNKIFPILQTLAIHLNLLGAILNDSFDEDLDYLFKYIKVRVHNQPFEDRDSTSAVFKNATDSMMKWSSRLALAFNPKQAYLFIDGIWKDMLLYIKKPDGTNSFSKENLISAWKFAMRDLFHFGDDLSLLQTLNMQYGMNDMDMNVFIDRVKTDNTGLFTHFWDTGFRFASRPDYYNRMTIFVAQMKADGCFDAHVKKDGKWVYDWKLDKRFDEFAKAKGDIKKATDKEKFNKLKSEYIAIARQLVEEGARNEDGSLFEFDLNNPKALPKAYTNRQSESMKALADRIYGYYAHEKKSMINSTWAGSLIMLMNTYMSAKKNQYALTRSYTLEGYFTDYEEEDAEGNKQKWYWKLGADGELEPTIDKTDLPIRVWKGRPLEGIILTVANMGLSFFGRTKYSDKIGFEGYREFMNSLEPDVARLYSANFRQLLADLFGIIFLGTMLGGSLTNFLKSFEKEHDNKDFGNAMQNSALSLLVGMYTQSTEDFHAAKSLLRFLGRGPNWTPFSWTMMSNLASNVKKFLGGDQDIYDTMVKIPSATRTQRPFWNYVKINTFGEKIGE